SGNIVLIAIDSPSIDAVGVWPWPRGTHAQLIEKLESAGVTDIAFDVDFSSPSNPDADRAFVQALRKAGGSVILPSFKQQTDLRDGTAIHRNRPLPEFAQHAWPAIVNVSAEPNGVVRRYPLGEVFDKNFLPSMAAVMVGKHDPQQEPFWVDFGIRLDTI